MTQDAPSAGLGTLEFRSIRQVDIRPRRYNKMTVTSEDPSDLLGILPRDAAARDHRVTIRRELDLQRELSSCLKV